jgi:serine/threonine-protein kinase
VFVAYLGMPSTADTLLPPRYDDVRPLAHGGMGEIFRARDRELGREVAVKVLSRRYAQDDALRSRFRREALAAARLSSNPNIVTIFDVEEHDGRPMIVMEYLDGGSLEARVRGRTPCPPRQVLEWLEEAAVALDAAHAAGIVHRDVKPGNLLLDDRGHVKVADFGVASAAGLDSFTQAGTILGTAGYLSPEQARGDRAGPASDRYALAVVAYELLTGRRPFERDSPTAEAAAHATTPVPSVHAANPALPRAFDAIFSRALAKEPAARYPTAVEFVGDLRRALHDDAGDTWAVPVPPSPTHVLPAPRREPAARRSALPWLLLLLLLAGAGGILAAVLLAGGSKHASSPRARTVVHTVTGPGTTVQETVTVQPTTTAAAPPTTAAAPPPSTASPPTTTAAASGSALNDAGYSKMQSGDYTGALPLLQQAVEKLTGTGSVTEAYADYNLAYTRFALGQCTDVLSLLDRSESIQGRRRQIDKLRRDAQKRCGG